MIDLGTILRRELAHNHKPNDGKLHPSTHLDGNLRHAWLDWRGHEHIRRDFANEMRLQQGNWVHDWIPGVLRDLGVPFMSEVKMGMWLPAGWEGTLDMLEYLPATRKWRLHDFKTTEDLQKYVDWGINPNYVKQISSYGAAVRAMGLDIDHRAVVHYIPIAGKGAPIEHEVTLSDTTMDLALAEMVRVMDVVTNSEIPPIPDDLTHTRSLASGRMSVFKQHHMSRLWCPFPAELCGCKVDNVKWKKIGELDKKGEFHGV